MTRISLVLILSLLTFDLFASSVRIKDLARIQGNREVAVVGYGLVVGLSGSGDSSRNRATVQSLANVLERFGLQVEQEDLSSRNVAAVMVTGTLPPFSEPGDRIDLRVASTGDARSLSGGTLLLTALYGPDDNLYALGQGALTVGGYNIESFGSSLRKNQTTVGQILNGGSVEQSPPKFGSGKAGLLTVLLDEPDYTTADRMVNEISILSQVSSVAAKHPGKIEIQLNPETPVMPFISQLENLTVSPDVNARLIVNERTGTIVAGGNVTINELSIAHGNLRIEIQTDYNVSQPGMLINPESTIRTAIVPETSITVTEDDIKPLHMPSGTTVAQLVQALHAINVSTRDTISILEAAKSAGALHAELIIQ